MRYAIISDVHSNKQAINVVITDIKLNNIDKVICLGDIVGYGPSPKDALEVCYKNVDHFILGNHDAAATGKLRTDNFNDNAKFLIDWTTRRLDDRQKKFFSSMPLMLKGSKFRCSHGSLRHPGRFLYILEEEDAQEEFKAFNEQIAFVGHSHVPGIFVIGNSGKAHWLEPIDFSMEEDKRYIVNVGSVGQPRDNDIRASYCIYDDEKGDILFRKVVFDIEAYRGEMIRAGLPEKSSYFVDFYITNIPKSIRDTVGFKPLSKEDAICGAEELRTLEGEVKKLKKIKIILAFILTISLVLCGLIVVNYIRVREEKKNISMIAAETQKELAKKSKTIYKTEKINRIIPPTEPETEIITMPTTRTTASATTPLINWIIELSVPEQQSVTCEIFEEKKTTALPGFIIKSNSTDEIILKFSPVEVKEGTRYSASAQFKKISLDAGHISLALLLEKKDGTVEILASNTPNEIKSSNAWTRNTSVTLRSDNPLREDGLLYYAIIGNFKGEILIRKCSLVRKK